MLVITSHGATITAYATETQGFVMTAIEWAFAGLGFFLGVGISWLVLSSKFLSKHAVLHAEIKSNKEKLEKLEEELATTKSERTELHERALKAEADKEAAEKHSKEQKEQLRLEFQNMSTGLLEQMGKKFSADSEKQMGDILNPFRERLGEFKKLVETKFENQGKEQHTLKSEIEKIVLQTDSLTKALRGDAKAQGNWGEVMLERILEESGLRRDIDYVVQAVDMNLTTADGSRQMPDVIVRLPDDKHIIIDAKVSLTAYDRYCAAEDDAERIKQRKEFIRSVKNHVTGLEQKRYQHNEKLSTPDMVLMFMPTEGAFSFAIQSDLELHSFAWGKKIVIVSPTTLFATLKTIASIWRIEQQNKYALQIADEGGKLYDKFVGFVGDLQSVGTQMDKLNKTYDGAMNKLKTGTGNLVGRAEKMKQLGAKATKALPADVVEEASDDKIVMLSASDKD